MEPWKKFVRSIATNIKLTRLSKHYTQDYMAKRLSISQNAYSKIELSDVKLTVDRFFEIAVILDTPVKDLMNPLLVVKVIPKQPEIVHLKRDKLRKAQRKNKL